MFIITDKVRDTGKHIYGYRCNESQKAKTERSKHLAYTGLRKGRGHLNFLKIEKRSRGERFESVRSECEI